MTASRAWPRLAEYFARFQLSLGLQCGLEVLAPSLSSIPLFIRPASQCGNRQRNPSTSASSVSAMDDDHGQWTDGLSDTSEVAGSDTMVSEDNPPNATDARRFEILTAATAYLRRPVEMKNVAHSVHPIGRGSRHSHDTQPTLEVHMIVYGPSDDDEEDDLSVVDDGLGESPSAKLMLVRMVNGVPLLDGAEATACGLVQGIIQKQSTWNSFGLHVAPAPSVGAADVQVSDESGDDSDDELENDGLSGQLFVPTYAVRDSDQVAPFIRSGTHDLYHIDNEDDESSFGDERRAPNAFLPTHLRLGNILLIVQIRANPSSLPLPTLSKVCSFGSSA